jgi:hypothetical protein
VKTEYGVPVPRGVPRDWEATSMDRAGAATILKMRGVPADWGDPDNCVAWFDRFGRCRAIVGHYANGRSALVRIDANGISKTTFGDVA